VDGRGWSAALPGQSTSGKEHRYALAMRVGGLQSHLDVSEKSRSPLPLLVLIRILSEHLVDKERRLNAMSYITNGYTGKNEHFGSRTSSLETSIPVVSVISLSFRASFERYSRYVFILAASNPLFSVTVSKFAQ